MPKASCGQSFMRRRRLIISEVWHDSDEGGTSPLPAGARQRLRSAYPPQRGDVPPVGRCSAKPALGLPPCKGGTSPLSAGARQSLRSAYPPAKGGPPPCRPMLGKA